MAHIEGTVDVQVNGYAGIDFNSPHLTVEEVHRACEALQRDGAEAVLATVITDYQDAMVTRLKTIATAHRVDSLVREIIHGIHIEGPFINETPGFVGAHPVAAVRLAEIGIMQSLLDAAAGLTRIVTLAPERDPAAAVTRFLSDQQIVVSAGHCDASLDQLRRAMDSGLSMFTHLGNGCPETMHRHDNIVQRVLSLSKQLTISFIGDGVHVPYFALRNYLDRTGLDRVIIVTDAILAAGLGAGEYQMAGRTIVVDEAGVTRYPGNNTHFVGSAATMPMIARQLEQGLGLNEQEIRQLICDNPRRLLNQFR